MFLSRYATRAWRLSITCSSSTSATSHALFRNCVSCGLVYCQQNRKLVACTFCGCAFDAASSSNNTSHSTSALKRALEQATAQREKLIAADSDETAVAGIRDECGSFVQTQFCSETEIEQRRGEIEAFKARIEQEQEQKRTFDLSKMLRM